MPRKEAKHKQPFWNFISDSTCLDGSECNADEYAELIYKIAIQSPVCQMWDSGSDKWARGECDIQEGSTPSNIVFKSNLFGSFGAGLFTAPNTIDFGSVFDNFAEKVVENMLVIGTILGVLLLAIPLIIICRRYDKNDMAKVGIKIIIRLTDTLCRDSQKSAIVCFLAHPERHTMYNI